MYARRRGGSGCVFKFQIYKLVDVKCEQSFDYLCNILHIFRLFQCILCWLPVQVFILLLCHQIPAQHLRIDAICGAVLLILERLQQSLTLIVLCFFNVTQEMCRSLRCFSCKERGDEDIELNFINGWCLQWFISSFSFAAERMNSDETS